MTTITAAEYRKLVEAEKPPDKESKYKNKKCVIDGITFDSKAEAKYYERLWLQRKHGEVTGFDLQVPYRLEINDQLICKYVADFVVTYPDGRIEVIDVKGVETPEFKLKRKLMRAIHNIEVLTVTKQKRGKTNVRIIARNRKKSKDQN